MAMHTKEEKESIPQDIIIQILSWLPIKSLMRFRCVSKFYNSIVLEPNFVDLHSSNYSKMNRGDTKLIAWVIDYVCYAIEDHGNGTTKYFRFDNFNKLCDNIDGHLDYNLRCESDNGLFCIWDVDYIAICNPTTREVRFLPLVITFEKFQCSIGFEPEENKYKVLLTVDNEESLARAWVFTLGIDKSWREIIKYDQQDYLIPTYRSGVCINGIMYRYGYGPEFSIVAFDLKSEIFTTITLSIQLRQDSHGHGYDYLLIQVNGKLGILNFSDFWPSGNLKLWVLGEECQREEFRLPLGMEDDDLDWGGYRFCQYHGDEIVFAIHSTSNDVLACYFYHFKNKSWRYFQVQEFPGLVTSIFTYTESLFPLENVGTITNHNYNTIGRNALECSINTVEMS